MTEPQPNVIRITEASRSSYRNHRRWRTPTAGTRTAASDTSLRSRCVALSLVAPPEAIFIDSIAAALRTLPTPIGWTPDVLEIATRVDGYHLERPGVRSRRRTIEPLHVSTVDGLRVTTASRTFVDLGAQWPLTDLVALGDAALRQGQATPESIIRVLAACTGQRGVRRARQALAMLDARSRSPQESRLRVALAVDGLPTPEVNGRICDAAGEFLAVGDLVFREHRTIVEYDGAHHRTPDQQRADAARRNLLALRGWLLITIVARDLAIPGRAAAIVREALAQRPSAA